MGSKVKVTKGKAAKHILRVVIPDSHGAAIDIKARDAFLKDLKVLQPDEIVMLGDHVECSSIFTTHNRSYAEELNESYTDDIDAANCFLDAIQSISPNAKYHYLEGNHESRVNKWATRMFHTERDVEFVLSTLAPQAALRLKEREIKYYRTDKYYQNISIPGTIRLGKCFFVHGISHAKNAAQVHLARFGANVVFGHVHRSMSLLDRTVVSDSLGSWCPGTLAKSQMFYMHGVPSGHTHGYAFQSVNTSTGTFMHVNVPIHKGTSLLHEVSSLFGRAA